MQIDQLPEDVAAVVDWGTTRGFVLVEQRLSESFGDCLLVFERSLVGVRLVRDRGQWSLDIDGRVG